MDAQTRLAARKAAAEGPATVTVTAPQHVATVGLPLTVPISTTDLSFATTGVDVISYQFVLTYDPLIISAQTPAVTVAGTISDSGAVTINQLTPGVLQVVVTRAMPFTGAGTLFNFKFNAVGTPGQISPLTWQTFQFNEGDPIAAAINGQVRLVVPTAANVAVGGRLLTANGQPISNTRVTMAALNGMSRSALSSPMGYYRFDEVEVGQTYIVSVKTRRFTFQPLTVSILNELTELNLVAEPE